MSGTHVHRRMRWVVWIFIGILLLNDVPSSTSQVLAQTTTPVGPIAAPSAPALPTLTKPTLPTMPTSSAVMPVPAPVKVPPLSTVPEPSTPAINAQVQVGRTSATVGDTVPFSITLTAGSALPVDAVRVTLPVPAGATVRSGPMTWQVGTVPAGGTVVLTGSLQITAIPPSRVLALAPAVTGQNLPAVHPTGGVPLVAQRIPALATFVRGQVATLQSMGTGVTVQMSPQAYSGTLQLRQRLLSVARADLRARAVQIPTTLPTDPAFEPFVLDATDSLGQSVHQFSQPVTITVSYTPEQLDALHIPEGALAVFWFNETTSRWVALSTNVDRAAHTASTVVDHFSYYTLGSNLSPSAAFLPSTKNWQVDLLTGAASYSYPINTPAAAGGMRPDLTLNYTSADTDGDAFVGALKQGSWVGKGWSLNVPYIGRNRQAGDNTDSFSLVLNGRTSDIVRGSNLPGFANSENYLMGWNWYTTDESFVRVRYDPQKGTNPSNPGWIVWTKDGTRYEFRDTARWDFQGDGSETYKWMVSTVTDTHGNQMTYTYNKFTTLQCSADPDIWPTRIQWGGNPQTNPVTPMRYTLEFSSTARTSDNDWDQNKDMAWASSHPCSNLPIVAPHETQRLRYIRIRANVSTNPYQSGSITDTTPADDAVWPEVREYRFTTGYTMTSDTDDTYKKLTLGAVQMLGNDGASVLPPLTFQYGTTGVSKNRLVSADNNQGGTVSFSYTHLPDVYTAAQANTLFGNTSYNPNVVYNRFRVNQRITTDGRGNSYVTKYTYGPFAVNTANGTQYNPKPASNSAVLERAQHAPNTEDQVASKETREFRGHESVIEKTYNSTAAGQTAIQWAEHFFRLGDVLDVAGCGASVSFNESDMCYQKERERELEKGREWQTIWKQDDGTANGVTLKSVVHTFALATLTDIGSGQAAPYSNNTIDATALPNRGLWRAFVYESATNENIYEGQSTPQTHLTTYAYDATPQGGVQAGNLTRIDESFANTNKARTRIWQYLRRDDISIACAEYGDSAHPTLCTKTKVGICTAFDAQGRCNLTVPTPIKTDGAYIIDRQQQEADYDSSNANGTGNLTALTNNYYDNVTGTGITTTLKLGDLLRFTRYTDVNAVTAPTTTGRTLHGVDTMYTYDGWGNRITATSYAGLSTRATSSGGVVTWIAPQGAAATTTTGYDTLFHQYSTSTTNPPNASNVQTSESAGYDPRMGTLTSVTDPNGNITTATYDAFGRIFKVFKPGDTGPNATAYLAYLDWELPVRYTLQTKHANDTNNDPLSEQSWFYDGLGRTIQTKQESLGFNNQDIVTDMRYDALDRVIAQSQPQYSTTENTFQYKNPGTGALYRPTITTYDGLGRVYNVTDANNQVTQTRYYQVTGGWAASTTDVNNHKVRQEYDVLGRMTAAREYANGGSSAPDESTTYAYSPLDLLTQVLADAGATNVTTNIAYDSAGRKTSMSDPDMGSWTYTYDGRGNLATQLDARGVTTSFGYDLLSRLTQKTFSNGNPTLTYGYDDTSTHTNGKSQRTSMCVSNGSSGCTVADDWNYDTLGNTAKQTQSAGGITRAIQWTYDLANRVQTITYPDSHVLSYSYDAAGRQIWGCFENNVCATGNAQYNALSQPTQRDAGNNLTTSWTYANVLSRLSHMNVGTLFDRSYAYDPGGNVTGITDNKTTTNNQTFGYDARDRLTSWTLNGTTQNYGYNVMGNLTSKAGTSYSYGQQSTACSTGQLTKPHAVVQAGSNAYCYDQNGNMLTGNGRTYTWNAQNQPTQIAQTGVTETYTYDGDGNRALRTTGSTTTFYLSGLWEEDINGEQRAYYPFNGETVAMTKAGVYYFLHGDHLGSMSLSTNTSQALSGGIQEFDPWGKVRSGAVTQTTRNFTGQQLDGTGLLYYNARYYDPSLGRFTSADSIVPGTAMGAGGAMGTLGQDKNAGLTPLTTNFHEPGFVAALSGETSMRQSKGFWFQLSDDDQQKAPKPAGPMNPQALNRYSYVLNNPVRYSDPSGHSTKCLAGSVCSGGIVINNSSHDIYVVGDRHALNDQGEWATNPDGSYVWERIAVVLHPGQSTYYDTDIVDADFIQDYDGSGIDGHTTDQYFHVPDLANVSVTDRRQGGTHIKLRGEFAGWLHWKITGETYGWTPGHFNLIPVNVPAAKPSGPA